MIKSVMGKSCYVIAQRLEFFDAKDLGEIPVE